MSDVRYASLKSQGVQHRVLYRDGHPSRYQPRPTGLNFGEQTGTGVFPLVIAVPLRQTSNDLSVPLRQAVKRQMTLQKSFFTSILLIMFLQSS